MKNIIFILIGLIFITAYACSKVSTGSNISINTSGKDTLPKKDTGTHVSKDTTIPVTKDTAAFYNMLSVFMKQGTTWDCYRFDTLEWGGGLQLGSNWNPYYGNWQKNLVADTINRGTAALPVYEFIYKDSSLETFTVSGKISFADLKMNSPTIVNNLSANAAKFQVYDTSTLSILTVKNKTRNTVDTEFVFLSKSYFAIFPQVTTITAYGNTAAYKTTDLSLINIGIQLSSMNPVSYNFTFLNKLYQGDLTVTNNTISYGRGFLPTGRDSTFLLISKAKGLLKQTRNANSLTQSIGGSYEIVNRINVLN